MKLNIFYKYIDSLFNKDKTDYNYLYYNLLDKYDKLIDMYSICVFIASLLALLSLFEFVFIFSTN